MISLILKTYITFFFCGYSLNTIRFNANILDKYLKIIAYYF